MPQGFTIRLSVTTAIPGMSETRLTCTYFWAKAGALRQTAITHIATGASKLRRNCETEYIGTFLREIDPARACGWAQRRHLYASPPWSGHTNLGGSGTNHSERASSGHPFTLIRG